VGAAAAGHEGARGGAAAAAAGPAQGAGAAAAAGPAQGAGAAGARAGSSHRQCSAARLRWDAPFAGGGGHAGAVPAVEGALASAAGEGEGEGCWWGVSSRSGVR